MSILPFAGWKANNVIRNKKKKKKKKKKKNPYSRFVPHIAHARTTETLAGKRIKGKIAGQKRRADELETGGIDGCAQCRFLL
jgi:hypothetical protein